jgi:hypothetical protein
VCRAKYWESPTRRQNTANFFDISVLLDEEPDNASAIEGLTPENPIMMESTRDFPYAQVVPLAPIVWQIRAPRVPCSGFGDKYNEDILGAGECTERESEGGCDPTKVTTIDAILPHEERHRSVYITYEEPAFHCYDRSRQATAFHDKSWNPRATYADLVDGRLLHSADLDGDQVFWKFIPDIRYVEAPIRGTVFFNKTDPCRQCDQWSEPDCTDPIEDGPLHPMWNQFNSTAVCSARWRWIELYLNAPRRQKKSTFLTAETTQLTIAALAITPQMEGLADITTLVRVVFDIDQNGNCEANFVLSSTSDTDESVWVATVTTALVLTALYMVGTLRRWGRGDHLAEGPHDSIAIYVFDLVCSLAIFVHLSWNMYLEFSPPYILEELEHAFEVNEPPGYFESIRNILAYVERRDYLKRVGFVMVLVVFMRLVHLLSFHPRLSLIVDVTARCTSDLAHFFLQYLLFLAVLAFLGHWMFGFENSQYATFTSSAYTLTRFFIGDFTNPASPPSPIYFIYIMLYILVAFIMMVNFLLAIVVDAYASVMDVIRKDDSEQDIVLDLWDTLKSLYCMLARRWPSAADAAHYLQQCMPDGVDIEEMPAVTAEEFYEKFRWSSPERRFKSLADSRRYLRTYADKLWVNNRWHLRETRSDLLFQEGHYYGEADADPLGICKRVSTPDAMSEVSQEDRQVLDTTVSSPFHHSSPDHRGGGGSSEHHALHAVLSKLERLECKIEGVERQLQLHAPWRNASSVIL